MNEKTLGWIRPENLEEALKARLEYRAIPLAGATDLYVRHRALTGTVPTLDRPIVYIGHLPELTTIEVLGDEELRIGAAAVYTDIAAHPATPAILALSIRELAAAALRNIGTLGGNIANASPAADAVCALYALHAEVEIMDASGTRRRVPIGEVITGPGQTVVADDELITAVVVPLYRDQFRYYRKVGTRRANALSKIALAACGSVRDGRLEHFGLAIGAVGPVVVHSPDLERRVLGSDLNDYERIRESLRTGYVERIAPISDQRSNETYRRVVAANLVTDFLDRIVPAAMNRVTP